jgi:hypothetical protein
MKAKQIFYDKQCNPLDDSIIEMVIWQLPKPVYGSVHRLKYRLFYGRAGQRIVGYDNERGKGDHKHFLGVELPYDFTSPEQLIADFLADVRYAGGKI